MLRDTLRLAAAQPAVGLAAALVRPGSESRVEVREALVAGGLIALGAVVAGAVAAQLWRAGRRERAAHWRGRGHSLLHHLDVRAARLAQAGALTRAAEPGQARILQVVLTGGPCAGKSSAIEFLAERLRVLGYDVYTVPEVPTILLNAGCVYPGLQGGDRLVTFEASLLELQLQMEQSFFNIARSTGRPSVLLYDRGLLDVGAYLPPALWQDVLNFNAWVRDGMLGVLDRYDLIVHLVTAAAGAERHFEDRVGSPRGSAAATTPGRLEAALREARALDAQILNAYRGHPHHVVVDNAGPDFDTKLARVFAHLEEMVRRSGGAPAPGRGDSAR
jgi:hypothetical protein